VKARGPGQFDGREQASFARSFVIHGGVG
jgi:hypothetical protein